MDDWLRAGIEEARVDLANAQMPLVRARDLAAAVDTVALLGSEPVDEPPYWMHLWPGALVIARRLLAWSPPRPHARVLEIGCGLALPALCAARQGARVVATDWVAAPLRLARLSAVRNAVALDVVRMDWTRAAVRGPFDLCLGADIAYAEESERALVALLGDVLPAGGAAWLADSVNTHRRSLAGRLEGAGFALRETTTTEVDEGRPVWVRLIEARRR